MLDNVRRNLCGAMHVARIRRARSFRLHLQDPTQAGRDEVSRHALQSAFDRVLQPLMRSASRIFTPDIAEVMSRIDAEEFWRLLAGRSAPPPVIECPVATVPWSTICAHGFDPYYLAGGERDAAFERSRTLAKRRTARRPLAAFIPTRDLAMEIVASAAIVEAWYREAVRHATLTWYLWPPGAKPARA